jgi:hypothetical protein
VFIASHYAKFINAVPFDNFEGDPDQSPYDFCECIRMKRKYLFTYFVAVCEKNVTWMMNAYVDAINDLLKLGKRVVLLYPIPEAGFAPKEKIHKRKLIANSNTILTTSYAAFKKRCSHILNVRLRFFSITSQF